MPSLRRRAVSSVAVLLVGCLALPTAPGAAPARVSDCRPCSLAVLGDQPRFDFTFNVVPAGDHRRTVASIEVSRPGVAPQTLAAREVAPIAAGAKFFFGVVDLHAPGYGLVMLLTSRGAANSYAQYWLYVAQRTEFVDLGTFPVLKIDPKTGAISSYERGGHGGREYTRASYVLEAEKLLPQRVVLRVWDTGANAYVKTVTERRHGALVEVSRAVLKE